MVKLVVIHYPIKGKIILIAKLRIRKKRKVDEITPFYLYGFVGYVQIIYVKLLKVVYVYWHYHSGVSSDIYSGGSKDTRAHTDISSELYSRDENCVEIHVWWHQIWRPWYNISYRDLSWVKQIDGEMWVTCWGVRGGCLFETFGFKIKNEDT